MMTGISSIFQNCKIKKTKSSDKIANANVKPTVYISTNDDV